MDADEEIRRIRLSAQKTLGEISKLKSEKGDMATGAEILLAFLILQTHDESDDALDLLEVGLLIAVH
jgi:DNA polymerase phi